ncbi:PREDICTED: putative spermatogenesis-associated protein 31D3 [Chinchilla lanigera]|uniref:putative spermatogenesis-associated protein 31D3 n=1 Tax=Chinchilla lanigera TaxID=34839 RepID=UPI00038ECE4B|nr:PREDICTED: putative spermatogenesis-associated protein 31D3 [Chinchilla lanigera]
MENVLPFLRSHTKSWLSSGSTFLDIDSKCTFLSAVGLLLLLFCFLLLKSFLSALWRNRELSKNRNGNKQTRRDGREKGWRTSQQEAERKKLFSTLKSHRDTTRCGQLLYPDSLCEVCHTTASEASHLFSQVTSLADSLSPSALAGPVPREPSPPSEPKFPTDCCPLEPILSPLLPAHHTQEAELVLQPEAAQSLFDSLGDFFTHDLNSAEASFGEPHHRKPRNLRFLSPDTQALLKREQKKTNDLMAFLTRKLLSSQTRV